MKHFEVTFEWPNGDWSWIYIEAVDYHQGMLRALLQCPRECRVHHLQFMTAEQVEAREGDGRSRVGKHEARK